MRKLLLSIVLTLILRPALASACACGCGMFEVGTSAMLPTEQGGMAWLEYDFLDQDKNWSGSSSASSDENEDKRIKTHMITAGARYMFNRRWGMSGEVPYWDRTFRTTNDDGDIVQFMHSALGDIRVKGVYTGFSPDMSSGITFGLKLPTGDHKFRNFDRDTSIGTGSTDVLLGAYHVGHPGDNWSWFVNGEAQQSVLITPNYRPGSDVNVSIGGYFNGRRVRGVTIVPLAQVIGSQRWSDTGEDSDHPNTGYRRLVLSPGVEFDFSSWRLYADVGFPVYQYVNGNQLVATAFYKVVVGRSFR